MTDLLTPYPCRVDGGAATAVIADDGLSLDGRLAVSWLDADLVREADHSVTFVLPDAELTITHLGSGFDRFCRELREARGLVRRAALTQSTGPPLDSYVSQSGREIIDVHLCAGCLVVEPRGGAAVAVPLPSIVDVSLDGWKITVTQRVFEPVIISGLGQRTDEFMSDLRRARDDLGAATRAAAGVAVDDGWAVEPAGEIRAARVGR